MKTTTEANRPLCPREIRGMLTIAAARPEEIRAHGQPLKAVFFSLESAIARGQPDLFLKDCDRQTAANWCRK